MSIVINLFGGPGSGKSTLSADVFAKLKLQQKSAELVREYVKSWVYDKRAIGVWDQIYILSKQIRGESSLYLKCDYIVTDSPILLVPFYEEYLSNHQVVKPSALNFIKLAEKEGIIYLNFWLERPDHFQAEGRNQGEEESVKLDVIMKKWLQNEGVKLHDLPKDHEERMRIVFETLTSVSLSKK